MMNFKTLIILGLSSLLAMSCGSASFGGSQYLPDTQAQSEEDDEETLTTRALTEREKNNQCGTIKSHFNSNELFCEDVVEIVYNEKEIATLFAVPALAEIDWPIFIKKSDGSFENLSHLDFALFTTRAASIFMTAQAVLATDEEPQFRLTRVNDLGVACITYTAEEPYSGFVKVCGSNDITYSIQHPNARNVFTNN